MTPAIPRPAASVVLLRRGGRHRQRDVEVLLVRRSTEASFMPGVWVFPGGVVAPDDAGPWGEGRGTVEEREERAPRACAARELGEEAGIELPTGADLQP